MGNPDSVPSARGRFVAVAMAVFLANFGLLVLQLAAGRLLAPFVGSSLETWTAVIGAFLSGIALGNAVGGRAADRHPSGRRLAGVLAVGGVAALWMLAFPRLLAETGFHRGVPLGARIPLLAAVLCFPAGFALILPTPFAVRLMLADVRRTGRVAGVVFALGTLGCLAGNYATGFVLIPSLTVDVIVAAVAAGVFVTASAVLVVARTGTVSRDAGPTASSAPARDRGSRRAGLAPHQAYLVVFLCSFAGMSLELAATRLMAQVVGVSLYTWTGVIGVMLAGTAAGNWLGGILADRAGRSQNPAAAHRTLAVCLAAAAAAAVMTLFVFFAVVKTHVLTGSSLIEQVLIDSFVMFFPPMFALGTISPQVIRLTIPDVGHAGRVAGRVYAWSTAGAIVGTFATGFFLISAVGMYRTVLLAAGLPALVLVCRFVVPIQSHTVLLYLLSLVAGVIAAGFVLFTPERTGITRETNYFTIRVGPNAEASLGEDTEAAAAIAGPAGLLDPPGTLLTLQLDLLIHSKVKPTDPTFLFYKHEAVQTEWLRWQAARRPDPRVLVIGGGGYTFPRCARTLVPSAKVDVVEIDPGVTAVAYENLGLDPALGITSVNMDGRQFVAERAAAGGYDLVTLDAVNDLTVPAHLLTEEFNDEVRRALTPDGIYLLTVIDHLAEGRLWRAAFHTLKRTYPHVRLILSRQGFDHTPNKMVMVLYASAVPLDEEALRAELARRGVPDPYTHPVPADEQDRWLSAIPPLVLTDQYAPVDNLMADVFRKRDEAR